MGFLAKLFGNRKRSRAPRHLMETLQAFIQARTWEESRRLLDQHPELLSDEADALLGRLQDAARARSDEHALRILEQHRVLLRRCREVGAARAFAEQMLPPEVLEQAEAAGLTPEQLLEIAQLAAQIPPEVRELLAELGPVSNKRELEEKLRQRPDLRRKLEEALSSSLPPGRREERGEGQTTSPQLPPDLRPILEELRRPMGILEMPHRIELCLRALRRVPRAKNPALWAALQGELGNSLAQNPRGDRAENLERAIEAYRQALEVRTREAMPDDHRRTQRSLGHLLFREGRWEEAAAAYRSALEAGERLYQMAATPEARRAELREVQAIPARLAYALVEAGDAQAAVVVLEQNRARWLAEALALESERPDAVPDAVWETFVARREEVRRLQAEATRSEGSPGRRDFLALSPLLARARQALHAAIEQVRTYAPAFMPVARLEEIRAAAAGSPLVYLLATPAGGLALIVREGKVTAVPLPQLTEEETNNHLWGPGEAWGGYLGAYLRWLAAPNEATRRAWFDVLESTLDWLGEVVMKPLRAHLPPGQGRLVLIPTGRLAILPLHAARQAAPEAPTGYRYLLDDYSISYAPSALALAQARAVARTFEDRALRLFAVDNPDGTLKFSQQEVQAAASRFEESFIVSGKKATLNTVKGNLPDFQVWHFSTHGTHDWRDPLESALLLVDVDKEQRIQPGGETASPVEKQRFTLRELLTLPHTTARLAVLSACETGMPDIRETPEEMLGLPAGFLRAGAAGVIGTLWVVNDLSTAWLMAQFYALWREAHLPADEALRRVQQWLRDRTDFAHPFYWAAMSYYGAG